MYFFQIAKYICLRLQNIFVSDGKMYLLFNKKKNDRRREGGRGGIVKCICLKLQNIFVPDCKIFCLRLQNVFVTDGKLYLSERRKDKNDKRGEGGRVGMPAAVIAGNTIAAETLPALCTHNHILHALTYCFSCICISLIS